MLLLSVFLLFLASATYVGWQAGDRADHIALLAILLAAALSALADLLLNGGNKVAVVFIIDVALLSIVMRHALVTIRHWPIWFAGIHVIGTLAQASILFAEPSVAAMLSLLSGVCAVAAISVMASGLLLDQKSNLSA